MVQDARVLWVCMLSAFKFHIRSVLDGVRTADSCHALYARFLPKPGQQVVMCGLSPQPRHVPALRLGPQSMLMRSWA